MQLSRAEIHQEIDQRCKGCKHAIKCASWPTPAVRSYGCLLTAFKQQKDKYVDSCIKSIYAVPVCPMVLKLKDRKDRAIPSKTVDRVCKKLLGG